MRGLGTFAAGHSAMTTRAPAQASPRVVIIGGGVGGTTVATYLKRAAPTVHVTLIERNEQLTTSVGSNLFLGGLRTLPSITHSYEPLRVQGIDVVIDVAIDVDASRKVITLMTGARISYDRLVLQIPNVKSKNRNSTRTLLVTTRHSTRPAAENDERIWVLASAGRRGGWRRGALGGADPRPAAATHREVLTQGRKWVRRAAARAALMVAAARQAAPSEAQSAAAVPGVGAGGSRGWAMAVCSAPVARAAIAVLAVAAAREWAATRDRR